jgi:hypothetical protein
MESNEVTAATPNAIEMVPPPLTRIQLTPERQQALHHRQNRRGDDRQMQNDDRKRRVQNRQLEHVLPRKPWREFPLGMSPVAA